MDEATREDPAAEWIPIGDLVPWDQNPRDNDQSVDEVAGSIRRFGFAAPIIARRADSMVIAGHTRLKAAQKLGINKVPVRWMDLDPAEARMLALADNKLNERALWDDSVLSEVLAELEAEGADLEGLGWDQEELDAIIADAGPDVELPEDVEPSAPPTEPDSRPGEVYELGPHRLVCGDSTDAAVLRSALSGAVPDTVHADPPYGIGYSGKGITANGVEGNDFGQMTGDENTDAARGAIAAVQSLGEPVQVWWGASYYADALPPGAAWFVWDKEIVGDVYSAAELAWTSLSGRTRMFRHRWHGMIKASEMGAPRLHPTQKPVALVCWALEQVGSGSVVLDPFGGSGSSLIACARTQRTAAVVEIDPRYCDVIRDRWTRWAIEAGQDPGPGALTLERDDG
tara:strand:+ start:5863 stop:7059 length:1197 start_codon:yes stop_codon:yes gene_type:complete